MSRNTQHRRTAVRFAALASVSLASLTLAAPAAHAQLLGLNKTSTPLTPMYGNIKPFYGDVAPQYGNLKPFYGNLKPFYGNLKPFWGNLKPFWGDMGAFYGDLSNFWGVNVPTGGFNSPQYLQIGQFWTNAGGSWDQVFVTWNQGPATDFTAVDGQMKTLVNDARTFWGPSVLAKTGKSFDDGFANTVLAKYGINLADPTSLSKLDQTDQALFFLDWYDGLMNFSGTDHVDHWMKTVNWNPALTQQQGYGAHTMVGLLDMTVVGDATLQKSVIKADGISTFTNGHGAAVASLIVGAHDGQGVMGIAPAAKVIAYNPFDSTGTAGWTDITNGVQMLKANGASVVNMSLGVPGSTFDEGWNNVFTDLKVVLTLKNTVFVMAAGNDGYQQNRNVSWLPILTPSFIVVGSVDLNGNISNFSNTPGSSCLTAALGLCLGNYLRDHFIVAPGEMLLVDDGKGGVVRESGTSFAAPLVSGAIALLQNRWPWLTNYPYETVKIILDSAKDLGAPGVDNVYGHGLLDVTASQSPLNFNNLVWYSVQNGQKTLTTRSAVLATYKNEQQAAWDAKGAYFYAFEPIGLTQRDFAIPLSSKLIGQNVTTANGSQEQFQAYLLSRMDAWANSATKQTLASSPFGHFGSTTVQVANHWGADMTLSIAPRETRYGFQSQGLDYQSSLRIQNERSALTFGYGDGAPTLLDGSGFAAADYDSARGGANPLLGLASGGAFAGGSFKLTDKLLVSAGLLGRSDKRDLNMLPGLHQPGVSGTSYQAGAQIMGLSYLPTERLTLSATYTHLHEATGLLGMQSLDPQDFRHGSDTDGYTLGANFKVTPKLSLMATGTFGKTRAGGDQQLAVAGDGLTTSAYEFGVKRVDLFKSGDRLQLSVSQPMYVERGHLNLTGVQVTDRTTGELGVVTQSIDISGQRQVAGEALYAMPVQKGLGYVALFGRTESGGAVDKGQTYMAGARYRLAF